MNTTKPTGLNTKKTWQHLCSLLQLRLSEAVYNTWILSNPLSNLKQEGDHILATFSSPSGFHSTNLKKNFHTQIKNTLEEILETPCEIEYIVGSPTNERIAEKQNGFSPVSNDFSATQHRPTPLTKKQTVSPRVEDLFSQENISNVAQDRVVALARRIGLRPDYTFETFAVSGTNEMAHAAATAVSKRPGDSYNPLFLYGRVGVGKTHLMQAIGNNVLQSNSEAKILYCTGEEFTSEIVSAIQTKKASDFKKKYRNSHLLLVDDVQFMAGKNAVQEEFFHTFNALIKQSRQIVLTSDRPPHEIPLLEERLRSRFEAGLMIDIGQPSFELRTAIFLIKAKSARLDIPIDLAKTIASQVESARKIEGIITSIRSEVELKNKEIDDDLISQVLQSEIEEKRPQITAKPGQIIKTVADHYHVKQSALKGKRRVKSLVTARHVAMFLLKKDLSLPLVEIGRWFSGRDHTSVLHAVNKIEDLLEEDERIAQDISALRMTLAVH